MASERTREKIVELEEEIKLIKAYVKQEVINTIKNEIKQLKKCQKEQERETKDLSE